MLAKRIALSLERIAPTCTAFFCIAVFAPLRDTPIALFAPTSFTAPALPATEMQRDAELHALVMDEHGAPLAGALLTLFLLREENAYRAGSARTDAQGVAVVRALPQGELWVLAEAAGHQRASTRAVLLADPASVRLTLRQAQELRVQVMDDTKNPLVGARVEVRGGDPLPWATQTDLSGTAHLTRLGLSPWTLEVSASGYQPEKRTGVIHSSPLRFELHPLGGFDVSVVTPEGQPAADATVLVAGSGLWPARSTSTDATGKAHIAGLLAGVYDLLATLGDWTSPSNPGLALGRGEKKPIRLELVPGHRITTKVMDGEGEDARPIQSAHVVLAEGGLSSFPKEGITNAEGLITLGPIAPGRAVISARADGFVPRAAVPVPSSLDNPIRIALVRGATVRGDVTDARGFAVAGASIEIVGVDLSGMPVDETPERTLFAATHFSWALKGPSQLIPSGELGVLPGPIPSISRATGALSDLLRHGGTTPAPDPWVTAADGRFRASPVPPGHLRALVRHPGYVESLSEPVRVDPGGEATVHVVLRGGGTLEGRVLDAHGRPVAGAQVDITATRGTLVRSTRTADDGTFAFAAVPSEVSLTVARPESPQTTALQREVAIRETERVEITLTLPLPRESITVRVVDDRGYPIDSAQVSVLSLAPESPLRTTQFTGKDGFAHVVDAAGLPLRMELSAFGYAPLVHNVESAERELTLTLGRASSVRGEVRDQHGRRALEGAEITLTSNAGVKHARTNREGIYLFRDLAPGPARLMITHVGYAQEERPITIPNADGDAIADVPRIELQEGGEAEGEVLDDRLNPVVGARVGKGPLPVSASQPLGALPSGLVLTDAKGHFRLPDLPEGELTLEAYAPGRGRGSERGVPVRSGQPTRGVRIQLKESNSPSE